MKPFQPPEDAAVLAQCWLKEAFPDRPTAMRAARRINASGKNHRRVESYRCEQCRGWHIGGVKKR